MMIQCLLKSTGEGTGNPLSWRAWGGGGGGGGGDCGREREEIATFI